jgi:hypothetical protein
VSKLYPGAAPPELAPAEQLAYYVQRVRDRINPGALAHVRARVQELALPLSDEDVLVFAALDNPRRIQWFLDTEVYYNDDHSADDDKETSMSPREVLRTGRAHCFEGALFAYTANFLHGFEPRWMLLEGSRDVDHNLVVYRDRHAVRWGCNAHSGYPHLTGRDPEFYTLRELAETYVPHYYSGYTNDPRDLTLVGFSDPVDLTDRFGVAWMGQLDPTWDLYYLLVDESWTFHRITPPFGAQYRDQGETHEYMLIRALKSRWIETKPRPFVNVNRLPPRAQVIWHEFWETFDPEGELPRGRAAELEGEFFKLTGTTPMDLDVNAEELVCFLERGYKIEQLVKGPLSN